MTNNLFADIPKHLPEEPIEAPSKTPNLSIERIVSHGHYSPEGFWYDQSQNEWVLVVQGAARIRFEGDEPHDLMPGSFVNIPAHTKHRVDWTTPNEPTIWLALFYKT